MKTLLEIKDLKKVYKIKRGPEVEALKGINLKLPEKGMVFLLGKSGSGKSTLLNILGGLDNYTSGDILVKGESTKGFKQKHFDSYRNTYVGFIFQDYNILEDFTVAANIALSIELQGRKATDEEVNKIIDEVELTGLGGRKPNELSGGQQQRVAIARALVKKPEIIMADEPTGALDSQTSKQIFDTLKKLSVDHLVLIVSHDREYSELYADRIIELKDGEVISDEEVTSETAVIKEEVNPVEYQDGVISVEKGYTLTEEDFKNINEYLKNHSIEIKTKNGKSSIRGNKVFGTTDETTLLENHDGFKLIKSKLSLKHSFKLGVSGLKHKKFKLVVSIILAAIAFTLFGVADTASSYDYTKVATNSMISSNIDYASFVKRVYDNDFDYYTEKDLTSSDIEYINNNSNTKVQGVINEKESFTSNIYNYKYEFATAYKESFSGFTLLNNSVKNQYGLNIECGNIPTAVNEIGITQYTVEVFKKMGYKVRGTSDKVDILSSSDMIGKTLYINGTDYTITCVINTNFNFSKYDAVFKKSDTTTTLESLKLLYLMSEFQNALDYSFSNLCYLSDAGMSAYCTSEFGTNPVEYGFAVGNAPSTRVGLSKLFKFTKKTNGNTQYFLYNHMTKQLEDFEETIKSLAKVFFWIGIFFVFFASLTLMNFISTSVSYKKQDIGILRAIGSRGSDVFKIFMSESFVIACINYVISVIGTIVVVGLINKGFKEDLGLLVRIFSFGIRQVFVLFAISVGVAALATFLPVNKFARKRPIDAIRNR